MALFNPSDDYKVENSAPESALLFGFVALFAMFGLMWCYVAEEVVNSVCSYNDRAMGK